jgi:hypothetical protein
MKHHEQKTRALLVCDHTLKTLERLEHFNELNRTKNIGILRSDLYHYLQILANIDAEHLLKASH